MKTQFSQPNSLDFPFSLSPIFVHSASEYFYEMLLSNRKRVALCG